MKIVRNTGTDRVIDLARPWLTPGRRLDLGVEETGRFPERLKPVNIKPDVDNAGQLQPIQPWHP